MGFGLGGPGALGGKKWILDSEEWNEQRQGDEGKVRVGIEFQGFVDTSDFGDCSVSCAGDKAFSPPHCHSGHLFSRMISMFSH